MPTYKPLPALDRLEALLSYSPVEGVFSWKSFRGGHTIAGSQAGSLNAQGRRQVMISGSFYYAHRLAWLFCHGKDPGELQVDHVNGLPDDNRIANLRLATHSQQMANRLQFRSSRSRAKGVSWNKRSRKWVAQIQFQGTKIHLGYFVDHGEAESAYLAAAVSLQADFASHLSRPTSSTLLS